MLIEKNIVSTLIPQDYPMIMVDGLLNHTDNYTESTLTITEENVFTNDGQFREPGIVENIAQTAALRSGYESFLNNKKPDVGFIGSVKNLTIIRFPKVGDQLITKVEVISELMGALVVLGQTRVNDEIIAEGQLNIFIQESANENN